MNEIKEDLSLVELEITEYFGHFITILKKNFLNFLPVIIMLLGLNTVSQYKETLAEFFSYSSVGEKIYVVFKNFGMEKYIDGGATEIYGDYAVVYGLRVWTWRFIEIFYISFFVILCIGITLSVCRYIEYDMKTNPIMKITKSFFRVVKFMLVFFLIMLIFSKAVNFIPENRFLCFIILLPFVVLLYRSIFTIQEYFYQKNSLLVSVKNSFSYTKSDMNIFGTGLLLFFIGKLAFLTFPDVVIILSVTLLQILFVILITLSYFNVKYVEDKIAGK